MKVLITGSSGLFGSALIPVLQSEGHSIKRLVRSETASIDIIRWDPENGKLDPAALEGLDAVVNLAGESISEGRWTATKKARIRSSRVKGTTLLAQTLAQLSQPPRVLVSSSAIGYYGDRGNDFLREDSGPGTGFLPDVCKEWEAATKPAEEKGIRVVILRTGIGLSTKGGALAKMLVPFKMGVGGKIGSGRQYFSWIDLSDMIQVIRLALITDTLIGAVNAVSPNPVTNLVFTKTLGAVLHRPTLFPIPTPAARIAFGEMADGLLLASARVEPAKLIAAGYEFRYPDLEGSLYHVLGR